MCEKLNYDCLVLVFEMLNLEEQKKTTDAIPQFVDIIDGIWRRKHRKINLSNRHDTDMLMLQWADEPTYVEFMSVISSTVEQLRLVHRTLDICYYGEGILTPRLNCLRGVTFGRVKILHYRMEPNLTNVIIFSKMFPVLTRLELFYDTTKQHGDKWAESLETITSCKLLEELYLHSDLLDPIMEKVLKMPRISKIVALELKGRPLNGQLLTKIVNSCMSERVHTLALNFEPEQRELLIQDTMAGVFSRLPNVRNFCTLASKEDYDVAFDDGRLQMAFALKSFDFVAFLQRDFYSAQLPRYRKIETATLSGCSPFQNRRFWCRDYLKMVALYCKLVPLEAH